MEEKAKRARKPGRESGRIRDWVEPIVEAALIVLVMFCLCWPVRIQGDSMKGTFFSGDRVFISRAMVFFGQIERDDMIMCKIEDNGHTENIIKRVIGMPGDIVEIQEGIVRVNGEVLNEVYTHGTETMGMVTLRLKKDMYFVMGDNRSDSVDSRDVGPIHAKKIIGKVFLRYYPFNQIKLY